jgi:hypothetical protein
MTVRLGHPGVRFLIVVLVFATPGCRNTQEPVRHSVATQTAQHGIERAHLQRYVLQTSRLFDRVLAARSRWEDARGLAAIRLATERLFVRERSMLRHLRSMEPPPEVGDRHTQMIAELVAQTHELQRLCAARQLDTDAIDTHVGRTFAIEQTVNELFTL